VALEKVPPLHLDRRVVELQHLSFVSERVTMMVWVSLRFVMC
jgi:hypothetical protein